MEIQRLLLTLLLIIVYSQADATSEGNGTAISSKTNTSAGQDDVSFEDYFWDEDDPKKTEAEEAFENYFGEDAEPETQQESHHRHHHNHTGSKQRQEADDAFENYFWDDIEPPNNHGDHSNHNHGDKDGTSHNNHGDHSSHQDHSMHADNGHTGHKKSDNGHTMDHNMMHTMKMYFHASAEAIVLIEEWNISSWLGMLGSCIVIVIIGALYEGLKVLKEEISFRCPGKGSCCSCCSCLPQRMCRGIHFLQTVLHVFQVFVSYLLMLVFMTYNVYLCLSVLLGAALGYFLFRWRTRDLVSQEEHCN